MIAGTKISLETVSTTLVETAVTTIIVGMTVPIVIAGTKILWWLFQQRLLEQLFLQIFLT